ncbi:MAG: Ig-like domain-containing protein [Neisseria zoodegmatis]|uniref:Ig-like domain-containing protein n=1 Tax=Neisseria zoodegmatis TaxID=326523 RepID=UPI0026F35F77|nr:Ig-like domain-containing protein [Neisseria zoodegmatis]MDO5069753.1 Ig-like domain-containing protein [Neisseria zoodegmatis]
MKSYTLNITRNGQTEALFLEEGAAAVVQAEPDTLYLVLDSAGEAVANPLMQWVENDLWVFLDGVQDESPDLVLKDYRLNFPIENSRYLNDTGSTFATAADEASLARISASVAEEVGITGWTTGAQLWTAAAVAGAAVAGIAAASSGGSDKKNDNSKPQENSDKNLPEQPLGKQDTANPDRQDNVEPTPPTKPEDKQDTANQDNPVNPDRQENTEQTPPLKPEITLNPMGENNVINADSIKPEQGLVLSGRLNMDAGLTSPAVSVTVGGKVYAAEISGDTWRLKLDSNALAGLQGEQKIAIAVTAQDAEGNAHTHTVEQTYTIDTQITAPVIEIDAVAQDDIINLVESQAASITVTGRVAHAQNGDEIVLKVGEAQYRGTVKDGVFSVPVDTKTLVNHGRISAEVTTRDDAANSATGTAEREYRVDTEYSPKISLNNVAGDNILNLAESKNKVTISGQVSDVADGEDVIVSCGCESCGSVKWIDILAKVRNGAFSVDFSGETLKKEGYNLIKAKVTSQDDAGNTATAETTQRYSTDLEAPAVTLSINPIGGEDNVLSPEERKAADPYSVSGTISGLQEGERIESLSVSVNGTAYSAQVSGNIFTAAVPIAVLAAATEVRASATVADAAGNRAAAEASRSYTVGKATPVIHLDPIAEDNIINQEEARDGNITVSGRVENIADGVSVNLATSSGTIQVAVSDGRFSTSVPLSFLGFKHNIKEVSGTLSAFIKNPDEPLIFSSQSYRFDLANNTSITIDGITGDNVFDADEIAKPTVIISGKVNDGKTGEIVTINIGNNTYTATVQEDGRYSAEVEIERIIPGRNDGKYGMSVSVDRIDQAGNRGDGKATASRDFRVDKTPPQGEIVFDKVGGDGVLNQEELMQPTVTITGKVTKIGEGDEVQSVTVRVGDKEYPATLTGSVFSVAVPTEELKANTSVSAQGMLKDMASRSTPLAESTETYEQQATPPSVSVKVESINENNPINVAHLSEKVSIKGSLTLGDTVVADTVSVTVEIGDVAYTADVSGKQWTLNVPATTLAKEEGRLKKVDVRASVADKYGNTASSHAEKEYDVDTLAPKPSIVLNAIGADDVVDADKNGNITVSGKVEGEFKDQDTVTLTINNKEHKVSINNTGEFSLAVEAAQFTGAEIPVLRAAMTTTDAAGNVGTAQASRGYSVKQGDVQIKLNAITSDDLINVTEAKAGKEIKISGSVSGIQAVQGQMVELTIGNEKLKVAIQQDLTFSTTVEAGKLLENPGYTVLAQIAGEAGNSAKAARSYGVDDAAAAKIDLNQIDNDFSLDVSQTEANTRIYGKIELEGKFAQGMNSERMRQITVEIGDKAYKAGVKSDRSFFLDIPTAELATLKGKELKIGVEADPQLYESIKWNDGSYRIRAIDKNTPVLIKEVEFTDSYIQKNSDGTYVVAETVGERMINVSGTVGGTAKAGDDVSLEVGGKVYTAKVGDNQTFTAQISAHDLAADSDHAVKAVLHTKDLLGKAVTVSDVEHYASLKQVDSAFVNAHQRLNNGAIKSDHTSEEYNFPYFIEKIGSLGGRSYNIPFGGEHGKPAVIKYHFMNLNEISELPENYNRYIDRSSMSTYSTELQDIVREAYKEISEVANIQFVEVSKKEEANTNYFMGNLTNGFDGASAIAYNGGLVAWNSRHHYAGWGKAFLKYTALHEITHTLGMTHTSNGFTGDYGKEESIEFSNMSYNAYANNGTFLDRGQLRPYDLAYLQYAYGPNQNTRTGNDIYTFKNYNMYSRDGDRYIWDAGGVDTFDASEEKQGVNVNLTPGSWIYVGENREKTFGVSGRTEYDMRKYFDLKEKDNIGGPKAGDKVTLNTYTEGQAFIGFGTQIENLIGSKHNDVLTGNKAANNIYGGAGDDTLNGGEGDDYLDGGTGADKLNGGTGNDTYVVDDAGDVVTENENEGNADHVFSSIESYTLGNHLEHLTLIGTTAITGQGNEGNNTIMGNGADNKLNGMAGNDRIIGGAGSDELTGGAGKDVFVFDTELDGSVDTITDFTVGQDMIELKATIFDSLTTNTMAEWDQYVKYDSNTGYLTYDKDGRGNADAIHFATLDKDLVINHTSFQVV